MACPLKGSFPAAHVAAGAVRVRPLRGILCDQEGFAKIFKSFRRKLAIRFGFDRAAA